jgi:hypothetical protein
MPVVAMGCRACAIPLLVPAPRGEPQGGHRITHGHVAGFVANYDSGRCRGDVLPRNL